MKKVALVALLAAVAPSLAQAKTLEDLLVEKGVITASEARGAVAGPDAKVYWKEGTRLEFPDSGFTTKINTQIQTRYTFNDDDEEAGYANTSSFSVRRARLILSGTALNKEFTYKLQADMVGNTDEDGSKSPALKDAYIQWEPCEGMGVRMGQFKPGISRQWNTESWALQFPDRSFVSEVFTVDRQAGARAFYSDPDQVFTAFASIYNGESDSEGGIGGGVNHVGRDTKHMGDVGVRANIMGQMNPFVEGDIDMTQDTAVNAGVTYSYSDANNDISDFGLAKTELNRLSADVNVKAQGFSLHGEFFSMKIDNENVPEDSTPMGFYTQLGYFIDPSFEIAGRYGYTDCDEGSPWGGCAYGADKFNEVDVSLNYYFWKHNLKAQLAWSRLNEKFTDHTGTDDDSTNDNRWMLQLSAYL